MKLCQPRAEHIRLNEPLPWDMFDGRGSLLLRKGFVLTDERQRDALLKRGLFVEESQLERPPPPPPPTTGFDPFYQWEQVHARLGLSLREHVTDAGFLDQIGQIARDIDLLTDKDPDASLFVTMRLDTSARYPIAHSLQTAFISGLIGRRMGLSDSERGTLLQAALTMNLAMIELQKVLHKQSGKLTEAQLAEVRTHPIRGWQRLEMLGVKSEDWLRAVAEHHETPDSKGYPAGRNNVHPLAEAIHLSDMYCALISSRADRKPIPANKAARDLFINASNFGSSLGALVVKELGIFPPGNFVRLANGEIAVVIRRGETANTPLVCSIEDRKGVKYIEPVRRDTAQVEYAVTEFVAADAVVCELNPVKLFGYKI